MGSFFILPRLSTDTPVQYPSACNIPTERERPPVTLSASRHHSKSLSIFLLQIIFHLKIIPHEIDPQIQLVVQIGRARKGNTAVRRNADVVDRMIRQVERPGHRKNQFVSPRRQSVGYGIGIIQYPGRMLVPEQSHFGAIFRKQQKSFGSRGIRLIDQNTHPARVCIYRIVDDRIRFALIIRMDDKTATVLFHFPDQGFRPSDTFFTPYYIALFQCRFEFLDISRRSVPLHTFGDERMGVQKRKKRFISRILSSAIPSEVDDKIGASSYIVPIS